MGERCGFPDMPRPPRMRAEDSTYPAVQQGGTPRANMRGGVRETKRSIIWVKGRKLHSRIPGSSAPGGADAVAAAAAHSVSASAAATAASKKLVKVATTAEAAAAPHAAVTTTPCEAATASLLTAAEAAAVWYSRAAVKKEVAAAAAGGAGVVASPSMPVHCFFYNQCHTSSFINIVYSA